MERNRQRWPTWFLCVVGTFSSLVWAKYGGGSGTATDPYLISTAEHLQSLSVNRSDWGWDVYYRLTADIDLAELASPLEPMGILGSPFQGHFDGNDKTLSNLRITGASGDNVGLFGSSTADIHDLRLVNVSIDAPQSKCVGALVGRQDFNGIRRCHVDSGTVGGAEEVGGLVGYNFSEVTQCSTACTVSGGKTVGGLLGRNSANCRQCCSTAAVSGTRVGGLVGYNAGLLEDCYAISDVHSSDLIAGGLIDLGDGTLWNCYAAGRVSSAGSASGLCAASATCYASFWDTESTGQASSKCGTGKTTAQMHTAATFVGWGRSGAWTIDEGVDYPRLAWEKRRGTPLTTPAFADCEGDGTAAHPYLIRTVEQLDTIGRFPGEWDKCYRLESDLDLAELTAPFHMMGCEAICFTGTFDGNGHSVSDFSYPEGYYYGVGMFRHTRGATIRRVILINPHLMLHSSRDIGPLIGVQNEGIVEACGAQSGSITAGSSAGGLIGRCLRGVVTRCYSTCSVTVPSPGYYAGGLIGAGQRCSVNNSYATGTVKALQYAGGLIGNVVSGGNVTHCYSTGRVTSTALVPGALWIGGLIGSTDATLVTACFWDVLTSRCTSSAGGSGCPTSQLYEASTYTGAGWDFNHERENGLADIWCIDEGKDYPKFFQWLAMPPQRPWADGFEDGESAPLWQVFEPTPADLSVRELNSRLELHAPMQPAGAYAFYISDGWTIDATKDFSMKVDFHFSSSGNGKACVLIGLTPIPYNPVAQYVDLTAGCQDGQPIHTGRLAAAGTRQEWSAFRGCDTGTLYISYDAASDQLYRSFVSYGQLNAWDVTTGVLKGYWAGQPLYVILGGSDIGMPLAGSDAWLDGFSVDSGDIVE
jgi:hypothetical protein